MSYLDTHFIKTSVINAAGKERLKIRELVNTRPDLCKMKRL